MKLEEQQKLIDEEKWLKSEQEGRDVCGEYGYCQFCNKSHAFPCANALSQSKKTTKKTCVKKAEPKAEKKTCAKKSCSKATKTTTKKTTKK